eukprot:jgi/Botrbrau1/15511/Bobra.0225s0003.2
MFHVVRAASRHCFRSHSNNSLGIRHTFNVTSTITQAAISPARTFVRAQANAPTQKDGLEVPLCEREPVSIVPLEQALAWRSAASNKVVAVGDGLSRGDGGPTAEELQIELGWLFDDATGSIRSSVDAEWENMSWNQIEARIKMNLINPNSALVQLRMSFEELSDLWTRRLQERVPIQYVTNSVHWRDLVLAVGPGVLIPRPETELLVDLCDRAMERKPELRGGSWADLGTGSGALAIALSQLLPDSAKVWAVEVSPDARKWAEYNVSRCGVQEMVKVVAGEWYDPLQGLQGQLTGIVSNPPYIEQTLLPDLQAEVRQHEPHLALDGGPLSGMDSLKVICEGALHMLRPGGFLALETAGNPQSHLVVRVLEQLRETGDTGQPAFEDIQIITDYCRVDRFVTCFRTL